MQKIGSSILSFIIIIIIITAPINLAVPLLSVAWYSVAAAYIAEVDKNETRS